MSKRKIEMQNEFSKMYKVIISNLNLVDDLSKELRYLDLRSNFEINGLQFTRNSNGYDIYALVEGEALSFPRDYKQFCSITNNSFDYLTLDEMVKWLPKLMEAMEIIYAEKIENRKKIVNNNMEKIKGSIFESNL